MATVPDPGTVGSRREIPELGVTVVTLSNGVEAWLKPTDFKNDQVLFALASSGGSSLAPPDKYIEAQLATGQVELSGAGGHRAIDLPKLTAGKIASASPFISLSSHGIQGSSTPANLETALQLLNIKFTAPGDDPEAFALIQRQLEAAVVNRSSSPTAVFGDKLGQVLTMGHYTSTPLTVERIAKLDRAGDGLFLSRALRQRRRLQFLHRRRLQSRRGAAAAGPLRRIPAVDEAGDRALQGYRAGVSREERERRRSRKGRSRRARR